MARQRYSRRSAPCTARYPSLLTALHLPGPHTRAKSRLLAVGGQNPARRGLSAGGEWIRTSGSAMRSHRQPRGPGRPAGGRRGPPHARQMAHPRRFESTFLQRWVNKLSVALKTAPVVRDVRKSSLLQVAAERGVTICPFCGKRDERRKDRNHDRNRQGPSRREPIATVPPPSRRDGGERNAV